MSRNRTLGAPYEAGVVTASFTTEPHIDRYLVQTPGIGPAVVVTLDPNAFAGDQVVIQDVALNAVTFPITLVGTIIGGDNTINDNGGSLTLTFSEQLDAWVAQYDGSSDTQSALGNYASIISAPPAPTSVGPGAYIVAAIVVTPEVSGIFRIDVTLGYSNSTATQAAEWALLSAAPTVPATPITISNGTPKAIVGIEADAGTLGDVTSTAGVALVLNNASLGGQTTLNGQTITSVAGLLTGQSQRYQVGGLFADGAGPTKTPYTIGQQVVFFIVVSADAGTIASMDLQFSVQEQPYV